jgi:hypothetical protein
MRLLGASAPKTEDGTIVGTAKAAAVTTELLRNSRLVTVLIFLVVLLFMVFLRLS